MPRRMCRTTSSSNYQPDPSEREVCAQDGESVSTSTSPQVNLFHEMVHGMHMTEGDAIPPDVEIPGHYIPPEKYLEEEARTIGDDTVGWGDEPISENTLRDELGMPRRRDIGTPKAPTEGHLAGPTDHRPGEDP